MSTPTNTTAPWLIVAVREIVVKLRDKSFIVGTLTMLALMIGSVAFSLVMSSRTESVSVAVTDQAATQLVAAANASSQTGTQKVELSTRQVGSEAELEDQVRSGDADMGLVQRNGQWTLVGKSSVNGSAAASISTAVRTAVLESNAQAAGTSVQALSEGATVEQQLLENKDSNEGVQIIAGIAFGVLFYMSAMLFGLTIANSVVEEKQSRIVEILAAAIPLRQLLVGKIVGATILALGQMAIIIAIGLVGLSFTDYSSMLPSLGGAAVWYLAFFIIGFVMLAAMYAVTGALATRTEDVQSTASPLIMVVVIATFGGMFVTGTWKIIASYVPVASTVAMPGRLLQGEAQWWEPILSLGITAAVAVAIIVGAEKVYRRSLMQTGGKLSLRQAMALKD